MRRLETILILTGIAFYIFFLHRLGLSLIFGYVASVGWGLAVTVALEGLARVANTAGWRAAIVDCPQRLGFWRLFGARVAGEAIDYVTPSAQLGGQLVMASMVRRKLPLPQGLASVVVAALTEGFGQICFILLALAVSAELAGEVDGLLLPIVGGLLIAIGLLAGLFFIQHKRPFFNLWRAAVKLDLKHMANAEFEQSAREADSALVNFYRYHRGRLALSTLCYFVAWGLGPVEIYLLLFFLGQRVDIRTALLIEALGILIERATFLIPAKLVSQEGGKALILDLLGYPVGIGFAVGFLRRIKEMVWVLFGLGYFMFWKVLDERAAPGEETKPKVEQMAAFSEPPARALTARRR